MSRVFILGSGFSTYAGAPVSRGVLPAIFAAEQQTQSTSNLKNFLTDFLFKGRENWYFDSGLEEVLSRLDLIKHYQPYPNINYNQVSYFEELLLEEFIKLLAPEHTNSAHRVFSAFGKLVSPGDTIISFNYDLIAEVMLDTAGLTWSYHLTPDDTGTSHVGLLKLHGSINQYYCPACGKVFETEAHDKSIIRDLICRSCLQRNNQIKLRHFIIAPTLFKSYTLPVLRDLWFLALEALKNGDTITFIGYSLPEADILSYQLFDFGRRVADTKQSVLLVNGPRHIPRRFNQIYGSELVNTGLYLEDWLDSFS